MGNPMIQVEHCPEIDDARTFEVEFIKPWVDDGNPICGFCVHGHAIFHNGHVIAVDHGDI